MMKGQIHESHPHPGLLSDFILGSQDGLVNVLGILLGLSAATGDTRIIIIAALAALGAESVSMGAVAYTSTLARLRFYQAETQRELHEMREVPDMEREEVRTVFRKWGYEGEELEELVRKIESKPKAMLDFMMAFELNLAPVGPLQPRNSALVVFAATVLGSFIPLVPFLVAGHAIVTAAFASIGLSAAALFGIGWYEATTTVGSLWKSGLRMLVIGLGAGFAGFLIGHFAGTL
ncbi:MAG TPA: VIT1/CCC1 transporter family protein [Thermoplasmata archaeon]|nr:VIT1/CCC1 transporter family protein [Thermoplasmata archaeon]